jgi:GntR family transcriptional regulator
MSSVSERSSPAVEGTYTALRDALNGSAFARGERLPGERELARRFGVSRGTLRQALSQLADEGRLMPHPQRGWFVPAAGVLSEPPAVLQSFTEMAQARGLRPTARVLSQSVRPAALAEAERLGIAPAAPVFDLERLRGLDGVPVCLDRSILPLARAPMLAELDLTDRSLFEALAAEADVRIDHSAFALQACAAEPEQAAALGIEPGAPVLVGDEVAFDEHDVPTMLASVVYRGEAYRFQTTLFRPRR